jgi:sarcosine oxidase subunit delta
VSYAFQGYDTFARPLAVMESKEEGQAK